MKRIKKRPRDMKPATCLVQKPSPTAPKKQREVPWHGPSCEQHLFLTSDMPFGVQEMSRAPNDRSGMAIGKAANEREALSNVDRNGRARAQPGTALRPSTPRDGLPHSHTSIPHHRPSPIIWSPSMHRANPNNLTHGPALRSPRCSPTSPSRRTHSSAAPDNYGFTQNGHSSGPPPLLRPHSALPPTADDGHLEPALPT